MSIQRFLIFWAACVSVTALPILANPAPGETDGSFGAGGVVRHGFGGGQSYFHAQAVQPDGKIVAVGSVQAVGRFEKLIMRYSPDGVPDKDFGFGGHVAYSHPAWPANESVVARSVSVQADGRLVVVGYRYSMSGEVQTNERLTVLRLLPNGAIDRAFGTEGWFEPFRDSASTAEAVRVQADSRIVVAGGLRRDGIRRFLVVRLSGDGRFDPTFAGTGYGVFGSGTAMTPANAVHVFPDGAILVGGGATVSGESRSLLLRITSQGFADNLFGSMGVVVAKPTATDNEITGIAIQAGNPVLGVPERIVVSATGNSRLVTLDRKVLVVGRFNLDGTVDPAFGTNGFVTTSLSGDAEAFAIATQGVGNQLRRIVVAGEASLGGARSIIVARYTTTGALDTTFAGTGIMQTPIAMHGSGQALSIVGGQPLVAGYSRPETRFLATVVRLATDGALDHGFGLAGIRIEDLGDGLPAALKDMALAPDGSMVLAGNVQKGGVLHKAVMRLRPDGTRDPFFGHNGGLVFDADGFAKAVAVLADGRIAIVGHRRGGPGRTVGTIEIVDASGGRILPISPSFGNPEGEYSAMVVQPDGRIVVVGAILVENIRYDFAILRFLADGSVDPTFGLLGYRRLSLNRTFEHIGAVTLYPNGSIVAAGSGAGFILLFKFHPNGDLDHSFGSEGVASYLLREARASSIRVQPDGKIVVATSGSDIWARLLRFLPDGSPDRGFGLNGRLDLNVFAPARVPLHIDSASKLVLAAMDSSADPAVARLYRRLPTGAADTDFGPDGVMTPFLGGTHAPAALRQDMAGRYLMGSTADDRFAVVRFLGDPAPHPLSARIRLEEAPTGGKQTRVEFDGSPGRSYVVRSAEDLSGPWPVRATLLADESGRFEFIDPPPLPARNFYIAGEQ